MKRESKMPKEEIKKLLENSKKVLENEHANYDSQIKENLNSFKKKTLDQI